MESGDVRWSGGRVLSENCGWSVCSVKTIAMNVLYLLIFRRYDISKTIVSPCRSIAVVDSSDHCQRSLFTHSLYVGWISSSTVYTNYLVASAAAVKLITMNVLYLLISGRYDISQKSCAVAKMCNLTAQWDVK